MMKISDEDLFPNERFVRIKGANAVIRPSQYGLSRFAFDKYMWVVGMQNQEAIGGKLYLTNYRLIFKSHKLNRLVGKFSILLPAITELQNSSHLMTRKMSVGTKFNMFDFVIWGVPKLLKDVERAQSRFDNDDLQQLRNNIVEHYDKFGSGLDRFGGVEAINKAFLAGEGAMQLIELATNPFEAIEAIALDELFDRTIVDSWQNNFEQRKESVENHV